MKTALQKVEEALADARCPVVLWSGGKDSQLLWHLVQEVRPGTPALWFRVGQPEGEAKRLIANQHMTVYGIPPADVMLLADERGSTLVAEYDFDGDRLPVLTDLEASLEGCLLTTLPEHRLLRIAQPWDVVLVGWKDTDTHWLKGGTPFKGDGSMLGKARVFAPLRHLTDEQVREAVFTLNIPVVASTDMHICSACMTSPQPQVFCPSQQKNIEAAEWDRQLAVRAFRQRHALEET